LGILSSFNIGVSGLKAAGSSMSVIGDNISNAQTFGFKGSRAEFQDILARSLKGIDGGDQIGSGTKLAHITPQFTQGNINRTENITDLAINGNGFFTVDTGKGMAYTRDGSMHFNKDGQLINGDGYKVSGFTADEEGKITQKVGPITLGSTTIPAQPTQKVDVLMNLDSRADIQQFDITQPEKTSNFNTSIVVYDNIGTQRLVTVYFNKAADGNWEYHGTIPGEDAQGGVPGTPVEMAKGKLTFDASGKLQQEAIESSAFNFNKGAAPGQNIEFNFGESIAEGGDGFKAVTQYGSRSSISRHTQDGSSAATLASLSFNDDGVLSASYDNGSQRDIAQIAIAKFENAEGMFKMGKNLFKETRKSGQAAIGNPGTDGRGEVLSKSIEL
jgi:flagellar hook protein FlgE